MAQLPTVNEFKDDSVTQDDVKGITKNLFQRFKALGAPSVFLSNTSLKRDKNKTVDKDSSGIDVLENLYRFIVQDTFEKSRNLKVEQKRTENLEKQEDDRQIEIMTAVAETTEVEKEEKDEGVFSKLWKYFKYFQTGRFVYRHWEQIEKLLGIEDLSKSIKNISDDIGITGVVDRIKKTIDDIIGSFTTGGASYTGGPVMEGDIGKILSTIRSVETKGSKDPYTQKVVGMKGSASGAYQFTDPTWQRFAKRVPGADKYQSAYQAPPEVQDAVAKVAVEDALKAAHGDVSKVPLIWYTGNVQGKLSESVIRANRGVRPETYQSIWLKEYERQGGVGSNTPSPSSQTSNFVGPPAPTSTPSATSSQSSTFVGPPAPTIQSSTTTTPAPTTATPSTTPTTTLEPTRVPRSASAQEPGELGTNSSSVDVPNDIQGIATEDDLRNLRFLHPDQKGILKILAKKVQKLRVELLGDGGKFIINSGYRDENYNKAVGGAKNSYHMARMAVDINVNVYSTSDRVNFIKAASRLNFGGIGVYPTFIHVDIGKRRTWIGHGYNPPQDIIDALRDHKNQTTPEEKNDIPKRMEVETGEKGVGQTGRLPSDSDDTLEGSRGHKDFIESAAVEYSKLKNLFSGLANQVENVKFEDLYKKFEPYISKNTEVPRREQTVPEMKPGNIQNNSVQNNIIKKQYADSTYDKSIDRSPLDK